MKRYTITLGATTSVGGKVISASASGRINGAAIAVEGDSIFCPACKSPGKIVCIEPRIPELWNGKKVALGDDLCICGCIKPPRLVANQSIRFQSLSSSDATREAAASNVDVPAKTAENCWYDDKFILLDEVTGDALVSTEYAIKRANGQIEFGVTDDSGHTHLLTKVAEAESIEIYV
jgi:uncharacterized Zn-binding protein involved in type VI secretion